MPPCDGSSRPPNDFLLIFFWVAGALYELELFAMCDYSLHGVAARPAKVGDKLVTTQFWNTTTRGFSAAGGPRGDVFLLSGPGGGFENKGEGGRPRVQR